MKKLKLTCLALIIAGTCLAQNTIALAENESPLPATIDQVNWIAGHWRGEAMGGLVEEIWSPPLGGAMMGSFKLVTDDAVNFYELETISEVNGSLVLKIKHFDSGLTGWEEKDETVDFPLVKLESNKAFFDGLTFELVNEDELNIYIRLQNGEEKSEMKFGFSRFK